MTKRIIGVAAGVLFFVAVVIAILAANLHRENTQNSLQDRGKVSLPRVSYSCLDMNTTANVAYADKKDAILAANTLLPCGDGKVNITLEGEDITEVLVYLESMDGDRLIDDSAVSFTAKDDKYNAEYKLSVLAENEARYYLTVKAVLSNGRSGYSSIILYVTDQANIDDKLPLMGMANEFSRATLQKNEELIAEYVSYDADKAGNDLSYVNLSTGKTLVSWAGLSPRAGAKTLEIYEWGKDQISIALCYLAESSYEEEKNEYYVKENFCLRKREDKYFLLDYERYTRQRFDGRRDQIGTTSILLGIQSGDELQAMNGATSQDIYFTADGCVWHYNVGENTLINVFGTPYTGNAYNSLQNDLKLVGEKDGILYFTSLGYVGYGEHEGENAVVLYEYNPESGNTAEKLYVKISGALDDIREQAGRITHLSDNMLLTIDICGNIYSMDLTGSDIICLVENVDESTLRQDENHDHAAWQISGNDKEISTMDLEKGRIQKLEDGRSLVLLGYIHEDLVYGIRADRNMKKEGFLVKKLYDGLFIVDSNLNAKKSFERDGEKLCDIILGENNVILTLCKEVNGEYEYSGNDALTLADMSLQSGKELIKIATSEIKRNYYYINLPIISNKNPVLASRNAGYTDEEPARLNESSATGPDEYIAMCYGRRVCHGDNLIYAAELVNERFGAVYTADKETVWNRDARALYLTMNLPKMVWTEEGHEEEMAAMSALERAIDILAHSGAMNSVITQAQAENSDREKAQSVREELKLVFGDRLVELGEADVSQLLYYVNLRHPVMAITDSETAYLIIGYTSKDIVYYNPADRSTNTITQDEAREFFGEKSAIYVTFR